MSHVNNLPASFDPFKTHPFTNISRAPPSMPAPSPYPRPVPTYQHYGAHTPSAPSSLPTAQTPVHSPQPQRASPPSTSPGRTHVFEPFKLERASPDLKDVLAKKGSNSPQRRPTGTGKNDAKQKAK